MDVSAAREVVDLALEMVAHESDEDADEWQDRFGAHATDLSAAIDVLLGAGDYAQALRLVGSLSYFCQDTGRVDEGRALAQQVVDIASDAGSDRERASAWLTLGELAFRQGDQPVALEATRAALAPARAAGDPRLELRVEMNLARVELRDGDAPRIRAHAERMTELAGDDPRLRFGATHMLAWAEYTDDNIDGAIKLFEENVETARAAGNHSGEGSELLNLGSLAIEHGDLDRAAGYLATALDIGERLQSSYLLPGTLTDIGRLVVLRGRPEIGLELIAAGERQYELVGLVPDPGDDAYEEQRASAVEAVGAPALSIIASGRALALGEAIARAREELGGADL
jgi:tetratricopeptide (TPR) repeat protein